MREIFFFFVYPSLQKRDKPFASATTPRQNAPYKTLRLSRRHERAREHRDAAEDELLRSGRFVTRGVSKTMSKTPARLDGSSIHERLYAECDTAEAKKRLAAIASAPREDRLARATSQGDSFARAVARRTNSQSGGEEEAAQDRAVGFGRDHGDSYESLEWCCPKCTARNGRDATHCEAARKYRVNLMNECPSSWVWTRPKNGPSPFAQQNVVRCGASRRRLF